MREEERLEWIQRYHDGDLSPDEMQQAERRLGESPRDRQDLESLRFVSRSMQRLPRQAMPRDFPQRVLREAERRELGADLDSAITPSATLQTAPHSRAWLTPLAWVGIPLAASAVLIFVNWKRDVEDAGDHRTIAQAPEQEGRRIARGLNTSPRATTPAPPAESEEIERPRPPQASGRMLYVAPQSIAASELMLDQESSGKTAGIEALSVPTDRQAQPRSAERSEFFTASSEPPAMEMNVAADAFSSSHMEAASPLNPAPPLFLVELEVHEAAYRVGALPRLLKEKVASPASDSEQTSQLGRSEASSSAQVVYYRSTVPLDRARELLSQVSEEVETVHAVTIFEFPGGADELQTASPGDAWLENIRKNSRVPMQVVRDGAERSFATAEAAGTPDNAMAASSREAHADVGPSFPTTARDEDSSQIATRLRVEEDLVRSDETATPAVPQNERPVTADSPVQSATTVQAKDALVAGVSPTTVVLLWRVKRVGDNTPAPPASAAD